MGVMVNRSLGTPSQKQAEAFKAELIALCEKHGVWIAHEDARGSFLIEYGSTRDWLTDARPAESWEQVPFVHGGTP
jgi:hypothetical protein